MTRTNYPATPCPVCSSSDVVAVQMSLREQAAISFGFCTRCEWKGWDREGERLPLTSVLHLAAR